MAKILEKEYNVTGGDIMCDYEVKIYWDGDALVWIAVCDEIPLALESESLDILIERVQAAAPEILELNGVSTEGLQLIFSQEGLVPHGGI